MLDSMSEAILLPRKAVKELQRPWSAFWGQKGF